VTELVLGVARMVRSFHVGVAPYRPVTPVGVVTMQPYVPPPFWLASGFSD
jgi:hypothetical protein